jgi:hypothetical protein
LLYLLPPPPDEHDGNKHLRAAGLSGAPLLIGTIIYRKNVKDKWPTEEFKQEPVPIIGGESITMMLAVREGTPAHDKV